LAQEPAYKARETVLEDLLGHSSFPGAPDGIRRQILFIYEYMEEDLRALSKDLSAGMERGHITSQHDVQKLHFSEAAADAGHFIILLRAYDKRLAEVESISYPNDNVEGKELNLDPTNNDWVRHEFVEACKAQGPGGAKIEGTALTESYASWPLLGLFAHRHHENEFRKPLHRHPSAI
jgi:hypothetical protein